MPLREPICALVARKLKTPDDCVQLDAGTPLVRTGLCRYMLLEGDADEARCRMRFLRKTSGMLAGALLALLAWCGFASAAVPAWVQPGVTVVRSEERRVGKEGRYRWSPY